MKIVNLSLTKDEFTMLETAVEDMVMPVLGSGEYPQEERSIVQLVKILRDSIALAKNTPGADKNLSIHMEDNVHDAFRLVTRGPIDNFCGNGEYPDHLDDALSSLVDKIYQATGGPPHFLKPRLMKKQNVNDILNRITGGRKSKKQDPVNIFDL